MGWISTDFNFGGRALTVTIRHKQMCSSAIWEAVKSNDPDDIADALVDYIDEHTFGKLKGVVVEQLQYDIQTQWWSATCIHRRFPKVKEFEMIPTVPVDMVMKYLAEREKEDVSRKNAK